MPHSRTLFSNFCVRWLTFQFIFLPVIYVSCGDPRVSVCTYNLWNVMFSWEMRMRHVASLASEAGCDVLMLQEVRLHGDRAWSQAAYLQRLMPRFRWLAVHQADEVTKPDKSYWTGWEKEGLAVLSKLPIGDVRTEHLSRANGPDTNRRIALQVPVHVDSKTTINIIVVHFSYHRQQQCQNAAEILKFIQNSQLQHIVVAGDFNVYPDFPDAVHLILNKDSGVNKCLRNSQPNSRAITQSFADAWEATQKDSLGLTFSNMPFPGLSSRPDRILVSSGLTVQQTSLHGAGSSYENKASLDTDLFFHRLWGALGAARDTLTGHSGFSCLHDCGPRGSCRCGVCVNSKDFDRCLLPNCQECSSSVFLQACVFSVVVSLILALAMGSAVKILVVASRMDPDTTAWTVLGCTCCLCHPSVLRRSSVTARHCVGRCLRCVGLGRLPLPLLLLLALLLLALVGAGGALVFRPLLGTVRGGMEEEGFPSDHLMLAARLTLKAK